MFLHLSSMKIYSSKQITDFADPHNGQGIAYNYRKETN